MPPISSQSSRATPTPGGYDFVVGVLGDGSSLGFWEWDEQRSRWSEITLNANEIDVEAGIDIDPIRIGDDSRGYLQFGVVHAITGLESDCAARIFVRSFNDAMTANYGDLNVGVDNLCVAADTNANNTPDVLENPDTGCTSDADCPGDGVCLASGACLVGYDCTNDQDCRGDEVCTSNRCVQTSTAMCTDDGDCNGLVCVSGQCMSCGSNGATCASDEVCSPSGVCVDANTQPDPPTEAVDLVQGGACTCRTVGATSTAPPLGVGALHRGVRALPRRPETSAERSPLSGGRPRTSEPIARNVVIGRDPSPRFDVRVPFPGPSLQRRSTDVVPQALDWRVRARHLLPAPQPWRRETDSIDTQRFRPHATHDGVFTIEGANARHPQDPFSLGFWLHYGHNPLVIANDDELITRIVGGQIGLNVTASYAFVSWFELGIDLPLLILLGDDDDQSTACFPEPCPTVGGSEFALGDIRLVPKFTLLDDRVDGFGLAIVPELRVPTHTSDFSGGARLPVFEPRVILDHRFVDTGFRLLGELGATLRGEQQFVNITESHELNAALGASYRFDQGFSPVELALDVHTDIGLADGNDEEVSLELLAGANFYLGNEWRLTVGGGPGVLRGYGTPTFRLLTGIRWEPAPNDPDGDGYGDQDDLDEYRDPDKDNDGQVDDEYDEDGDGKVDERYDEDGDGEIDDDQARREQMEDYADPDKDGTARSTTNTIAMATAKSTKSSTKTVTASSTTMSSQRKRSQTASTCVPICRRTSTASKTMTAVPRVTRTGMGSSISSTGAPTKPR